MMENATRCAGCGYSLAGIAETQGCPECGLGARKTRSRGGVAEAPTTSLTILLVGVIGAMAPFASDSLVRLRFFAARAEQLLISWDLFDSDVVDGIVGFVGGLGLRFSFGSTGTMLMSVVVLWLLGESVGATQSARRVWTRGRYLAVASLVLVSTHWWLMLWETMAEVLQLKIAVIGSLGNMFFWVIQALNVAALWAVYARVSGRRWSVATVCLLISMLFQFGLQAAWQVISEEVRRLLDQGSVLAFSLSSLWVLCNVLRLVWPEWKKRRQAELRDEA